MFVGGGYDAGGDESRTVCMLMEYVRGYGGDEHYDYAQDNKKGYGVYMFDADNGDTFYGMQIQQTMEKVMILNMQHIMI